MKTSVATMITGDSGPSILSSTEVNGNVQKLKFSTPYVTISEDSSY